VVETPCVEREWNKNRIVFIVDFNGFYGLLNVLFNNQMS